MLIFTIFVHVVMSRIFFANWYVRNTKQSHSFTDRPLDRLTDPFRSHKRHPRPFTNEDERARCGFFSCGETDFMTRAQYYSVHFYSVLSIIVFTYIIWQCLCTS